MLLTRRIIHSKLIHDALEPKSPSSLTHSYKHQLGKYANDLLYVVRIVSGILLPKGQSRLLRFNMGGT